MDSLLANYASSDEDDDHPPVSASKITGISPKYIENPNPALSIVSSLPPPKSCNSSSPFSFLPPPKSHLPNPSQTVTNPSSSKTINQLQVEEEEEEQPYSQSQSQSQSQVGPKSSSKIFSSLPQPKSQNSDPFALSNLSSTPKPNPKKLVQLKLPLNPSLLKSRDLDDEDDDKDREGKKGSESLTQTSSVKSFLSSIPAPRNSSTLGALPSAAGSGRRSILEADVLSSVDVPSSNSDDVNLETDVRVYPNVVNYDDQLANGSSAAPLGDMGCSAEYAVASGGDTSSDWVSSSENYESYGGYTVYENYDNHGQYDSNSGEGSTAMMPADMGGMAEIMAKIPRKRGRNEIPQEIVEVKQDELMKNRPREDQARLTGIAFGPSYQPASTKGKPTKLHKRKHQIGSLYFDMRQKEMELAERRAKGFLTKAETQAKYGW